MREPVTDCFGHSFERLALKAWVKHHNRSPVTGEDYPKDFNVSKLPVTYALKELCDKTIIDESIQEVICSLTDTLDKVNQERAVKTCMQISAANGKCKKRRFAELGGLKALLALKTLRNININVNILCTLVNFGLEDIIPDSDCIEFLLGFVHKSSAHSHLATKALYMVTKNSDENKRRLVQLGGANALCKFAEDTYARQTVMSLKAFCQTQTPH